MSRQEEESVQHNIGKKISLKSMEHRTRARDQKRKTRRGLENDKTCVEALGIDDAHPAVPPFRPVSVKRPGSARLRDDPYWIISATGMLETKILVILDEKLPCSETRDEKVSSLFEGSHPCSREVILVRGKSSLFEGSHPCSRETESTQHAQDNAHLNVPQHRNAYSNFPRK